MSRFRFRRRRVAAAALLALATMTTISTASAGPQGPGRDRAAIAPGSRSVPVGAGVTLRGAFPGVDRAPIVILYRAAGAGRWQRVARDVTGASGRFSVRVKPRSNGFWRAELRAAVEPPDAEPVAASTGANSASALDAVTDSERISVRSRTTARVSTRHSLAGRTLRVRGTVTPAGAARRVVVAIGAARETTTAGRNGRFSAALRTPRTGTYPVQVRARSNRVATGSRDRAGKVTVYRPAAASWYGPGLYGNPLACGGTLTPSTPGVAHKTLPCGTKLRLRYGHRSVAVRVIDRGPYVGAREFDLTAATRQRLGFGSTGTVLTSR